MLNKIPDFKAHVFLFLFLCVCLGGLFAFVLEEYWPQIRIQETTPDFPFSSHAFYIFCIIAYLLQGISYGLISEQSKRVLYETGILLFWGQFILGILWLGLFFGMHAFQIALFDLFMTFIMLTFTFGTFKKIDIRAAFLLVPYGCLIVALGVINLSILFM